MYKKLALMALASSFFVGCASVPMEANDKSEKAKLFNAPSDGTSGIYVFRKDTPVGAALKKDVWIDGKCIGETAKGIFFYSEVDGGKDHTISTESEFSANDKTVKANAGELYFFQQYIKVGVFVGGANLEQFDAEQGKQEVSKLKLAKQGNCNSKR